MKRLEFAQFFLYYIGWIIIALSLFIGMLWPTPYCLISAIVGIICIIIAGVISDITNIDF